MFKKLFITTLILGSSISLFGQSYNKGISAKETITDKELVVPEEIERNFDQLLVQWKRNLKPSSTCSSNYDTNVAYPDSVYINRLYSLPSVMELVYNPVVRSYIDMYTGRMRSSVEYFLGKSNYYLPIFEQALDKAGLPLELKYLPIIESALNPTIVSRAGATGLWQFMIGTGKMYGLEVNSLVDERRDPIRSTDAAVRYLKDLYDIYGDWNLVIAAYNCGPGNVNKAIKRNGGNSDYWAIYPYLPKETRGYVPAFIAATYVMNYSASHNICPFEYNYTHSTDTIIVDKQLHLQQVSDVLNVSIDEIRDLNPQFKNDIVPGGYKKYTLKLPSARATAFHAQRDSIYSYRANEFLVHRKVVDPSGGSTVTNKIRYKVKKGESLASIASKNGVTTAQVRKWNRLKSNKVRTGQILAINKTVVVKSQPSTTTESSSQTQYHAENKSNTPGSTAYARETEENDDAQGSNILANYFNRYSGNNANTKSNNTSSTNVVEEDDDATEETRTPNEPQTIYHKVRIGETLALIAGKYNVEKEDISKWNKLKTAIPKIGQRLVIHLPEKVESAEPNQTESEDDLLAQNELSAEKQSNINTSNNTDQFRSYGPSKSVETPSTNASASIREIPRQEIKEEISPPPAKKPVPQKKTPKSTTYTVKSGDNLGSIAVKFGGKITSQEIRKANNLKSDKLKIGQKLKIPR